MGVRLNTLKLFDLVISKVILTSIEEITQNMATKKSKDTRNHPVSPTISFKFTS